MTGARKFVIWASVVVVAGGPAIALAVGLGCYALARLVGGAP